MKNKQICPWCGEKLDIITDIDAISGKKTKLTQIKYFLVDTDRADACRACGNTILDKKLLKWKYAVIFYLSLPLVYTAIILICLVQKSDNNLPLISLIAFIATISTIYPVHYIFFKIRRSNQHYIKLDSNKKPYITKTDFKADISPISNAKQRKKEFVKDNILQISANGESEYIILTKADFETGKCEATFPVLKKENGLALLEKYSEFELSNGEEVLGTLKVEKVFE